MYRNLAREILKNVLPLTSLIKSHIEKTQFIKKIANKTKVNETDVWDDLEKIENRLNDKIRQRTKEEKTDTENREDQKEALIFEAERYGLKIDREKTNQEISKRMELKKTKRRFQEIAIELDNKNLSKAEKKKLENELKKIEKLLADAGFVGGYAVAGTELVLWEHDEDPPAPLTRPE